SYRADRLALANDAARSDAAVEAGAVEHGRIDRPPQELLKIPAFSRPPTSTASPILKRLPTRWLSGTPRVVRLRRWSTGASSTFSPGAGGSPRAIASSTSISISVTSRASGLIEYVPVPLKYRSPSIPRPAISGACSSACIGSDALAAIWMWSRWPHQLIGSRFAAASRGVTNVPLRSDDKRLFRRLPGRRPYALEPVRLGRRDRRSQHEPRLVRRPRSTAMHGRAVVPHDDVALAPSVDITQARRSRGIHELGEKFLRRRLFHALNRIGVRGKIERAAAVYRVPPHHAPALRRQRPPL